MEQKLPKTQTFDSDLKIEVPGLVPRGPPASFYDSVFETRTPGPDLTIPA